MLLLCSDSFFAKKCDIDIKLCHHQEQINEQFLGEDLIAIFSMWSLRSAPRACCSLELMRELKGDLLQAA